MLSDCNKILAMMESLQAQLQHYMDNQSTQSTPPPPQPITEQKKKKRNEKTRLQYKRRALQVTVQESEHWGVQSSDEASKHVVLEST